MKKSTFHLLFVLLLIVALPVSAFARCADLPTGLDAQKQQNISRIEVGQTFDDILDQGWIAIGLYSDFAPYSFKNQDGDIDGIDVAIGRLLAEKMGVEPRFYLLEAGENVDADLRNYVWKGRLLGGPLMHIMMHMPYDADFACRNEMVKLTGQYYKESLAIAYNQEFYNESPPLPAYFRFDPVAVENDTLADFYLSGLARGQVLPNVRRYQTTDEALDALFAGEVNAVMGAKGQLQHRANASDSDAITSHMPPMPGLAIGEWTLGLAVRHTNRDLGYEVDYIIEQALADGTIVDIFKRYHVDFMAPER